jgi:hypothetical protein
MREQGIDIKLALLNSFKHKEQFLFIYILFLYNEKKKK